MSHAASSKLKEISEKKMKEVMVYTRQHTPCDSIRDRDFDEFTMKINKKLQLFTSIFSTKPNYQIRYCISLALNKSNTSPQIWKPRAEKGEYRTRSKKE
ncbi:hypothetical protein OIU79_017405 [Salix purpurea]|uniref:Uncharacterized protein n=1 Tax=Salix purpurea TaxID=77065 RepID=A0A9Q0WUZ0_SALPP|nr:hypothetical protein OIU79_017405 [Salix purpurea]